MLGLPPSVGLGANRPWQRGLEIGRRELAFARREDPTEDFTAICSVGCFLLLRAEVSTARQGLMRREKLHRSCDHYSRPNWGCWKVCGSAIPT